MPQNYQWITEEIKRAIHKIAGDKLKWKHNDSNSMGFSKNNSKREDHSDKVYFKNSN